MQLELKIRISCITILINYILKILISKLNQLTVTPLGGAGGVVSEANKICPYQRGRST